MSLSAAFLPLLDAAYDAGQQLRQQERAAGPLSRRSAHAKLATEVSSKPLQEAYSALSRAVCAHLPKQWEMEGWRLTPNRTGTGFFWHDGREKPTRKYNRANAADLGFFIGVILGATRWADPGPLSTFHLLTIRGLTPIAGHSIQDAWARTHAQFPLNWVEKTSTSTWKEGLRAGKSSAGKEPGLWSNVADRWDWIFNHPTSRALGFCPDRPQDATLLSHMRTRLAQRSKFLTTYNG